MEYQTLECVDIKKQYCVIDIIAVGKEKLRLYDMGFFAGSIIIPLYECLGGGTKVYAVKETLIALRQKDAKKILVKEMREHDTK